MYTRENLVDLKRLSQILHTHYVLGRIVTRDIPITSLTGFLHGDSELVHEIHIVYTDKLVHI